MIQTMSNIDHAVRSQEIIPVVSGANWIFDGNEEKRFAITRIAVGSEILPGMEGVFHGYRQLRGRSFALKTRMTDMGSIEADGAEILNPDDERSVHFALVENLVDKMRVVGTTRHIIMSPEYPDALPVSKFFPESSALNAAAADMRPFEVSRWIQEHESKIKQASFTRELLATTLLDALAEQRGPAYCTVEEPIAKHLVRSKIVLTEIAPQRYVPEYNDYNGGYEIHLHETLRNLNLSYDGVDVMRSKLQSGDPRLHFFGKADNELN